MSRQYHSLHGTFYLYQISELTRAVSPARIIPSPWSKSRPFCLSTWNSDECIVRSSYRLDLSGISFNSTGNAIPCHLQPASLDTSVLSRCVESVKNSILVLSPVPNAVPKRESVFTSSCESQECKRNGQSDLNSSNILQLISFPLKTECQIFDWCPPADLKPSAEA